MAESPTFWAAGAEPSREINLGPCSRDPVQRQVGLSGRAHHLDGRGARLPFHKPFCPAHLPQEILVKSGHQIFPLPVCSTYVHASRVWKSPRWHPSWCIAMGVTTLRTELGAAKHKMLAPVPARCVALAQTLESPLSGERRGAGAGHLTSSKTDVQKSRKDLGKVKQLSKGHQDLGCSVIESI